MIAFQKYCQLHQGRIMGFTIFMGIMSLMSLFVLALSFTKDGGFALINEPMVLQGFAIPFGFLLLLLIHKVYHQYQQGVFFAPEVLRVYQAIAKITIYFALILKPAFFIAIDLYHQVPFEQFTLTYLSRADFVLAIVAYALNLVAGVTKLSREMEQEQELTI